jgi:hypothetical protein
LTGDGDGDGGGWDVLYVCYVIPAPKLTLFEPQHRENDVNNSPKIIIYPTRNARRSTAVADVQISELNGIHFFSPTTEC